MMNTDDTNTATLERPKPAPMDSHESWGDDDEAATGFKKWGGPLIMAIIGGTVIYFAVKTFSKGDAGPSKRQETTYLPIVLPPALPPPPPPPPPPEAMKEEKMIEEEKPEESEPDTAPAVSTALKASGGGGMVVAAARRGIFAGNKSGPTERMKWSAYASQTGSRISQALRDNPRTRAAKMEITVRVWVDITGRITRAKLDSGTGGAALDAAISAEIIPGMQLAQPPPDGMAMPVVLKVTARRPN